MDHAAASSEQTARTVFWLIVALAAAFVGLILFLIR